MFKTAFLLTGLHCEACVKVSKMKISDISGVQDVRFVSRGSQADGEVEAVREISLDEIQKALAGTGYTVSSR